MPNFYRGVCGRLRLATLFEDVRGLEARIAEVSGEIEATTAADDVGRLLLTIPVGPATQFRKVRDLAAWLGRVPRKHSTGGKTTLLGISKRGSSCLRRLLVHGARSCLLHLDRSRDRLGGLQQRMHNNKVIVALAAKMARIAWVVMAKPGATYERRVAAAI